MRALALFVLHLEKLLQNPALLVVAPFIALISIFGHSQLQHYLGEVDPVELDIHLSVSELKKETKEFHQIQLEEMAKIRQQLARGSDVSTSLTAEPVLGASTSSDLATSSPQMVYVLKAFRTIDAFEQPSTQAKKITTITGDMVYFFTQKQNGWYQIELDNNQLGWINQEFVQELP